MRMLKSYMLSLLILLVVTTFFTATLSAQSAQITIEDITYHCYKNTTNPTKYNYYINVTLYNSGDAPSLPLDIKLLEDETGTQYILPEHAKNITIQPNDYQTITFDWLTTYPSQQIYISYGPQNPELRTPNTAGKQAFTISFNQQPTDDSPGFELELIILVIISLLIINRKKIIL